MVAPPREVEPSDCSIKLAWDAAPADHNPVIIAKEFGSSTWDTAKRHEFAADVRMHILPICSLFKPLPSLLFCALLLSLPTFRSPGSSASPLSSVRAHPYSLPLPFASFNRTNPFTPLSSPIVWCPALRRRPGSPSTATSTRARM